MTDPIRPTDNDARTIAAQIVTSCRHGALGVLAPDTGSPMVTRIAVGWIGAPHILISDLSLHTKALDANPACSLLLGEPDAKGDPLTHPRITLQCTAKAADKSAHRAAWLARHPKAKLYFDFADFRLLHLEVTRAYLNAGFGKAYHLSPEDLPQT